MTDLMGRYCVCWLAFNSGQGEAIWSSTNPHPPPKEQEPIPNSPVPEEIPQRSQEIEIQFDENGDAILPMYPTEPESPPDSHPGRESPQPRELFFFFSSPYINKRKTWKIYG